MGTKKAILSCTIGLFAALFGGCTAAKKTISAKSDKGCNIAQADNTIMRLTTASLSTVSGSALPRTYTVFTATGEQSFFEAARNGGTAAFTLPSGCKNFRVSLSETMSAELAKRYPNLISLKGNNMEGDDLRLDWDGLQMRGQILTEGKSYLIEPHKTTAGGDAYILFDKADAATPRRPFEEGTRPQRSRPVQQQPTIQQQQVAPSPNR